MYNALSSPHYYIGSYYLYRNIMVKNISTSVSALLLLAGLSLSGLARAARTTALSMLTGRACSSMLMATLQTFLTLSCGAAPPDSATRFIFLFVCSVARPTMIVQPTLSRCSTRLQQIMCRLSRQSTMCLSTMKEPGSCLPSAPDASSTA